MCWDGRWEGVANEPVRIRFDATIACELDACDRLDSDSDNDANGDGEDEIRFRRPRW